jgi:hypothetical protein
MLAWLDTPLAQVTVGQVGLFAIGFAGGWFLAEALKSLWRRR